MVMMTAVTFVLPEKPLPGAKLCWQLLILVWDFLPSSGFPFIGLFRCGDALSSPLAQPRTSPTYDTRLSKVESSTISASTWQLALMIWVNFCTGGGGKRSWWSLWHSFFRKSLIIFIIIVFIISIISIGILTHQGHINTQSMLRLREWVSEQPTSLLVTLKRSRNNA